ncbi:aldo/keto reductase [Gayadomonas joobiniege]|uniref:aldo/keto reductase n=1 Tax=Gayadomonas joobiniege TaxID=1234606 RepID=UPI00035C1C12|nr:aldo/keto reductase [Gayadomonas joobiniege]
MKRVQLTEQLSFSQFIQGYWRLDEWDMRKQDLLTFIMQHLDLGITTVDHADIYGLYQCEAIFGQALALQPELRQQLEIVSKCGIKLPSEKFLTQSIPLYDNSAEHIRASVEQSLKNLHTDYLDTLLLHRPDVLMHADQVAETFSALKQEGKVRHFGVSNYSPQQFDLLQSRLDFKLVTNQVEFNPMNMQTSADGTFEHLQMHRIAPMIWSCLAGGRIFNEDSAKAKRVRAVLTEISKETHAAIDQLIYAFVLKLPCNPMPIIGSGNIERVKSAVAAANINLSNEQWYRIWVASNGHNVP